MENSITSEKTLFVKTGNSIRRVLSSDISYLRCEKNVTHLFLRDGEDLPCLRLLRLFEEDLAGCGFVRINHNIIVNLGEIREIVMEGRKRVVVLTGGTALGISARKWRTVKAVLLGQQ